MRSVSALPAFVGLGLLALTVGACRLFDSTPPETAPSPDTTAAAAPAETPAQDEPYALPGMEAERPSTEPDDDEAEPSAWTIRPEGATPDDPEGEDDHRDGEAEQYLNETVRDYLRVAAQNDVEAMLDLYENRVRYYNLGVVGYDRIREDKQRYVRRWPNRRFDLTSEPQITYRGMDQPATVRYDYAFSVRGDGRERKGQAWSEVTYRLVDRGTRWAIVAERGGTL